jgi:hypothetical protein
MSAKLRPTCPHIVQLAGSTPCQLHLCQNLRAQGVLLLGQEE